MAEAVAARKELSEMKERLRVARLALVALDRADFGSFEAYDDAAKTKRVEVESLDLVVAGLESSMFGKPASAEARREKDVTRTAKTIILHPNQQFDTGRCDRMDPVWFLQKLEVTLNAQQIPESEWPNALLANCTGGGLIPLCQEIKDGGDGRWETAKEIFLKHMVSPHLRALALTQLNQLVQAQGTDVRVFSDEFYALALRAGVDVNASIYVEMYKQQLLPRIGKRLRLYPFAQDVKFRDVVDKAREIEMSLSMSKGSSTGNAHTNLMGSRIPTFSPVMQERRVRQKPRSEMICGWCNCSGHLEKSVD